MNTDTVKTAAAILVCIYAGSGLVTFARRSVVALKHSRQN